MGGRFIIDILPKISSCVENIKCQSPNQQNRDAALMQTNISYDSCDCFCMKGICIYTKILYQIYQSCQRHFLLLCGPSLAANDASYFGWCERYGRKKSTLLKITLDAKDHEDPVNSFQTS